MIDWNKYKVVDLRAELKKRGLPQTGAKAALVERLATAENSAGSESDATLQGDPAKLDGSSATSPEDVSPILPTASDTIPDEPSKTITEDEPIDQPAPEEHQLQQSLTTNAQQAHTIESSQPPASKDDHTSALPSVEPQEANEDRQKRKRRSQSPPISASDAAHKRLRISDADETVAENVATSTSDAGWVEKHNGVDAAEINAEASEVAPGGHGVEPGPVIINTSMEDVVVADIPGESKEDGAVDEVKADKMEIDTPLKEEVFDRVNDDSPSRPRDSRFKTLFSGEVSASASGTRDFAYEEAEPDRIISPAIHPATAGLYISRLMRPINPAQFQAHLAVLAAPPGTTVDPEAIIRFYVDPIRTHAFASFTSVSAASRVRSALHDRIWPDEKTRKPLWLDFIPVEKVVEWIDQEEASNPGGRSIGKKWEVHYDVDDDRHVTAMLQEVNSSARPMHPIRQPSITSTRPMAPTKPRNIDPPAGPRSYQALQPSTRTLGELFKSTTATPVLYWQPVAKELANRRLDNIDRALSKDAAAGRRLDGESNRYTFEDDDVLVDRGPEIFSGIRPPGGHRGGGRRGGGYQGRGGGGYGGGGGRDTFRPNDGRRNDGPAYRNDRRGSRDYGRR